MSGSDILMRQLERVRFEKVIDYIMQNANGKKHLNAQELAHLNNLMTSTTEDPWRIAPATIMLPSGKHASFSLISNPFVDARNLLTNAFEKASSGNLEEAATFLYSQLVLKHFFKDANRRTAVAAMYWLLLDHNVDVSAVGLLEVGIGDIRSSEQFGSFRHLIRVTINIAKNRKPIPIKGPGTKT